MRAKSFLNSNGVMPCPSSVTVTEEKSSVKATRTTSASASYALLTHMVAQQTGLEVGDFVHTLGDTHLYLNHLEQAKLQLTREPRPLPTLQLKQRDSIDGYQMNIQVGIAGFGQSQVPA